MTLNVPIRRLFAVAALLAALGMALPRFLTHGPYPRLGARLAEDAVVQAVLGPPARGTLEVGDRLLRINGLSLDDPAQRASLYASRVLSDTIVLEYERAGEVRRVALPPPGLSPWERFRLSAFPAAVALSVLLMAFLLVWRRPDLTTGWVFLWFATLDALGILQAQFRYAQIVPTPVFAAYLQVHAALVLLYPASFVHFMAVFPRPRWRAAERWRNPWFWVTAAAYAVPIVLLALYRNPAAIPTLLVDRLYPAATALAGGLALVERYGRRATGFEATPAQRVSALLVALVMVVNNVGFGGGGTDRWLSALAPAGPANLVLSALVLVWLASPFVLAWLIAGDEVFDPRRLIVDGLPYALLSGVLAAVYLGIVLGGQRLFESVTGEQTLTFNLVAALVLAFAFAPLRTRLQRGLARLYGRDPEALRAALDAAGDRLLSALDRDEVRLAVEQGLARGLPRRVELEWPEHGTPSLRDPARVPDHARGAVGALLTQAGVRLENLRLTAERAAATQAELRALQAQVQPHFLFNALNALAFLIETDADAAQRFTERLADMLRYTVEAGRRQAVLLSDEVAFVEDYLGVARERYENPLHFRYEGDAALLSSSVPPLLLQPLVENSLKHGLRPGAAALHLTLRARTAEGRLELEFADDGAAPAVRPPGLGVGLENLEQRVRHFAGAEARVESVSSGHGGFVVRMGWPWVRGGEA